MQKDFTFINLMTVTTYCTSRMKGKYEYATMNAGLHSYTYNLRLYLDSIPVM